MLDLKDFLKFIVNMVKKQKKTMIKEIKEGMMAMSHQIDNINIEIKI